MNTKRLITLAVAGIMLLMQVPATSALEKSTLEAEAFDTIAGYTTMAEIEDALPNEDIEILVTKPNGSEVIIEAATDEEGEAKAEIDGYHLKKAGNYEISAKYANYKQDYGRTDSFKVYEDGVSLNKSTLEADSVTAAASGYDAVQLTVVLQDRYGNPIKGHSISILSSRNDDYVTAYDSSKTNEKGEAVFYAYSEEVGVSTYTAYDTTSDTVLEQRAKVAYFNPVDTLAEVGGDNLFTSVLLAANVSGETGEMDHFEIEDLDEEINVNELVNFTVTAYDANDNVVEDYMGTIRFSSSDDNADLPEDYTFEAEDQGTHTFSLSLRFTTTGTHEITVTDIDDRDLEGELEIEVISEGSGASSTTSSSSNSSNDSDVAITSPQAGTYSSTSLTVSGEAPYGYYIDLYDNGSIKDTVFTEADDTFSFDMTLSSGDHELYVIARDSDDEVYETSDTVKVTIDTDAATLDYIEVVQDGDLMAGDTFEVSIYSEPDLHQVGILLDDKIYELTEDISTNGKYSGLLVAPDDAGEYAIDVILVDSLANEIQYSDQSTITVTAEETEEVTEEVVVEEEVIEEETTEEEVITEEEIIEEEVVVTPSAVTGVEAVEGDSRVTLTWEAATSGSEDTFVQKYKIYYGPDPDLLFSTATTYDSSTTWYIPNLSNDQTYYFEIVAIDSDGNESTERSSVVTGMPKAETATETSALGELHDSATEEVEVNLEEIEETPESGPEIAWILLFTLAFSQTYFSIKKKIAEQS